MATTLKGLPIFVFCFTCHQNALSVTNELSRPTWRRSLTAAGAAVVMGILLYFLVGICGYYTFGD